MNNIEHLHSLPSGYRFNPTDGEIIVDYLRKKIDHQPLPMDKIIEVNLYDHDPDLLAAMYKPIGKDEWFYFSPRDDGQRLKDKKVGYWKATGFDKEIKHKDQKVGYWKALVFYRAGVETNWVMHEFRVADPPNPQRDHKNNNNKRLDDCVLCKVYRNEEIACKKRSREESRIDESNQSRPKTPKFEFINPNDGARIVEDSVEETKDQSMDNHHHSAEKSQMMQPTDFSLHCEDMGYVVLRFKP